MTGTGEEDTGGRGAEPIAGAAAAVSAMARRERDAGGQGGAGPAAGTPPPTTGLSRNVLLILAALVGITALVVMAYSASFRGTPGERADTVTTRTTPALQRPGFLDAPPRPLPADSMRAARMRLDSLRADSIELAREEAQTLAEMRRNATSGMRGPGGGAASRAATRVSETDAAYRRALFARAIVGLTTEHEGAATDRVAPNPPDERALAPMLPGMPQGAGDTLWARGYAARARVADAAPVSGDARARAYGAFLDRERSASARYDGVPGDATPSLVAGTVIPAVLLTDVSSDLPGDLVAQVTRDVFDSRTERHVVIARGSRLLGTYDNRVVVGQHRLLVAWTRLILADGRDVALPGLQGTDERGASGLVGSVDQHVGQQFGDALLLSLLGAGVELSQPSGGSGVLGAPSVGQVAGSALGQQLSEVALELVRRHADVPPTISVPVGSRFEVFVNRDLSLEVAE